MNCVQIIAQGEVVWCTYGTDNPCELEQQSDLTMLTVEKHPNG